MEQLAEMADQLLAQRLFKRKQPDPVDPKLQVAFLVLDGPLPDQFLLFSFANLFQEDPDNAIGCLLFQVFSLAPGQGGRKDAKEKLGGLRGLFLFDPQGIETGKNAGHHPDYFPGGWRQDALVKIIEIEIDQPVVTFVAAKIFEVQVAANPANGIGRYGVGLVKVFIEQVTGSPKKPKRVFCHRLIFQRGVDW